ncbi:MAG TPA: ABC transporter permease [Deltaproteobacteria bacterium]|nr:ABC transporter permease [Deltaproteobacteria bacterium]
MNPFEYIGRTAITFIEELGALGLFCLHILYWLIRPPVFFRQFFKQMEFIGVRSSSVVLLTGMFTGMVSALQSHHGFSLFGAEALVGSTTALGLLRELGPVLAALMVTARAGSAMTAEIGTMQVTEQIDALTVMAVNPYQYLIIPRIFAAIIMLPMLTLLFDSIGIVGSYVVGVELLDIEKGIFMARIVEYVSYSDLFTGLIKAAFFGAILSIVGCYKGFTTSGGAEGVGKSTTYSVVISSVNILIADYFLTAIMY